MNRKFVPPDSPAPSVRNRCAPSAPEAERRRLAPCATPRQVQPEIFLSPSSPSVSRVLCGLSPGLDVSCFLDLHSGDAVAFYFCDCITVALVFERIPQAGNPLQLRENESTQSLKAGIPGQSQAVLGFEITNVDCAFEHHHRFVFQRWFGRGKVKLVFDISYQLLENVFDGDDA